MRRLAAEISILLDRIEPWVLSPISQALLSILGVFVGLYGGLYTTEIRASFPFTGPLKSMSAPAEAFWLTFALAALGFFSTYNLQKRSTRRETVALRQAVMHAPPVNWIRGFVLRFNELEPTISALNSTTSKEDIGKAIRLVLAAVAGLLDSLRPSSGQRLGANLMIYIRREEISAAAEKRIEKCLKFVDPATAVHGLKGVLHLDASLSTVTTPRDALGEKDPELPEFCLAVPTENTTPQGKYRMGPGAPYAFCKNEISYFRDTSEIPKWARTEGDFTTEVLSQFQDYFHRQSPVQSFVSIPIPIRRGTDIDLIAVMNIHSNKRDFLPLDQEQAGVVCETLSAFHPVLAKLLELWKHKQE